MTPSLDPRSPLVLDTRALQRRPGTMEHVTRVVPAPGDFGSDVIGLAEGSPIDVDVRLESVLEGVLVSGSARGLANGACVRCLDPVSLPVEATFQELFSYADRAAHHHDVGDADDDEYELVNDLIDLEPVLRDAVVPNLPFQPVCSDDCQGLCSVCGARLADDPGHQHESLDPRWAALKGLVPDAPSSRPVDEPVEKRN